MSKTSVVMLEDTRIELTAVGDKVRADGWYGTKDGIHTVSWHLEDFTGRIFIEASLETDPKETDWFPIFLDGAKAYVEYPLVPGEPTGIRGDTDVDAYTFEGNFLWLRVRMDKTYYRPLPTTDSEKSLLGSIKKVLLNH